MSREYFVIDAFATTSFTGNPAAVVLDVSDLDDSRMQHIAAEFNLSETTFVLPPDPGALNAAGKKETSLVRFRWFTPSLEVRMCGHATIAGIHALSESGRLSFPSHADAVTLHIDTLSGRLTGFIERVPGRPADRMIWLALPDPLLRRLGECPSELVEALRLDPTVIQSDPPPVRTQDNDVIIFIRDVGVLNDVFPDFGRLGNVTRRLGIRGLCLATLETLTPSVNVQSRFFAPAAGINEDPVTGSVHGPLAALVVEHGVVPVQDGAAAVTCVQGLPGRRAGLLYALVQPKEDKVVSVRIGGRAVTVMHGVLFA